MKPSYPELKLRRVSPLVIFRKFFPTEIKLEASDNFYEETALQNDEKQQKI